MSYRQLNMPDPVDPEPDPEPSSLDATPDYTEPDPEPYCLEDYLVPEFHPVLGITWRPFRVKRTRSRSPLWLWNRQPEPPPLNDAELDALMD
jgi:hypothetical protein